MNTAAAHTSSAPCCESSINCVKYSDFGKSITDLFTKDFPIGTFRLEAKKNLSATKGAFGKNLTVNFSRDLHTNASLSEAKFVSEKKCSVKNRVVQSIEGTTILNSANVLSQKVDFKGLFTPGLSANSTVFFLPSSQQFKAGLEYAKGCVLSNATVDFHRGPVVSGESSLKFKNIFVGGDVSYDIGKGAIEKYSAGISICQPKYKIAFNGVSGFSVFTLLASRQMCPGFDVAARGTWTRKTGPANPLNVELMAKALLSEADQSFVKAKVDNTGRVAVAVSTLIANNLRVVFGASFETRKPFDYSHKLGFGVVFDA